MTVTQQILGIAVTVLFVLGVYRMLTGGARALAKRGHGNFQDGPPSSDVPLWARPWVAVVLFAGLLVGLSSLPAVYRWQHTKGPSVLDQKPPQPQVTPPKTQSEPPKLISEQPMQGEGSSIRIAQADRGNSINNSQHSNNVGVGTADYSGAIRTKPFIEPTIVVPSITAPVKSEWMSNSWVEGDGDVGTVQGGGQDECLKRCLAEPRCRFVEFYAPTNACNSFSRVPQILQGGRDSFVAIKK
jgi:hypothetical protein